MKNLFCFLVISYLGILIAPHVIAQTDTVTGNGDPNYIPLWISTGGGGGGGGQEEDNTGTTSLLGRTNIYYLEGSTGIGRLGIGTTYPWAPLHVIGESIVGEDWERIVTGHWYNGNPNHEIGYLGFNMFQMANATWYSKGDGEYNGGALLFGTTTGNLHFSTIPSNGSTQSTFTESTIQNNIKMTVTPTGRVGINTKTPSQALEVCHRDTTGGINLNQLDTSLKKSEIKFSIAGVGHWSMGHYLSASRPNSFFIWNQNREKTELFIADNGMMGINTEWPAARLDVNGDLRVESLAGNGQAFLQADNSGHVTAVPVNSGGIGLWQTTNGTDIYRLNGKVGIGVIPPGSSTYKLLVEGGIVARDLKVTIQTPFPDFVFSENYPLKSLRDLESFIHENRRLPEMPSAEDITREQGFEVGEMQIKLVKKIEELTLYLIDQQKQIDELKSLISSGREEKR
ncbi:MAG: hypothetical protein NT004_10785 [Bacteroidetes bacterium]|nr:hypothetical protein [Bacteroidota bacterium]